MLKNNPYMKAYLNTIKESSISTVSIKKYQKIAEEIGGEYIPETNTIDCKRNKVYFKNDWLDENGSFDFKLINTSNDWSFMFNYCTQLKYLPDDFIIPDDVKDCSSMFQKCTQLKYLPENFTIPESVKDCDSMFFGCYQLVELPPMFHIPYNCHSFNIFFGCDALHKLRKDDPQLYVMHEI